MSSTTRNIIFIALGVIAGFFVLKVVLALAVSVIVSLFYTLLPILIVGGILYALYAAYGRKALSGGRRTLP